MVTIKTYQNVAEAGYAHSLLEAMGIRGFLHGENDFLGTTPTTEGVRLLVEETDAEAALRILDQGEGLTPLPDDFVPPATAADEHPVEETES